MKNLHLLLLIAMSTVLAACSALGEINNSIDYVNQATEHINKLNTFAEEAPQLIKNAASDPAINQELETKLETLKQDIQAFIELNDIPSIAEEIHQELVNKNEVLLSEINKVLDNGNVALEKLENSQIFTTLNEVTSLMDRIENLGK
ncbi:DUF6376 family protein [Bacillus sp. T33-2]|uniref:DUF6376 family protein n=1 Tax=Bacillus sp. T33-2 TaxID=2054168 RepID=UPI000C795440|nr:DUF6376 family protein [Bacillus sp. T33-2]PLR99867.1 hypothetical protein CVD19_02090 [Bacillus sp. T33-2]